MTAHTDHIQIRDEGDIITITLAPSQHTRTITVTKGPRISGVENVSFSNFLPRPDTSVTNASSASSASSFSSFSSAISSLYDNSSSQAPGTKSTGIIFPAGRIDVGCRRGPAVGCVTAFPGSSAVPELPSHLRQRPPQDRFRVSNDVLNLYPAFRTGWKKRCWVVVIRGRDIGIFHDFWGRIWPLIKHNNKKVIDDAYWRAAESQEDAVTKWESAVEEGLTARLF